MLNRFRVHPDKTITRINRHIYGHFAEHIGHGIYEGIYVGERSSIPNTNGLRNDVITALKNLNVPNLRWPGGCFADTYHWKDGIGPRQDRPGIVNQWWGNNTEDNSFGTHDFLNLCELLSAEPYIAANVGSGSVRELMDWVQYVNFEGESPMSNLRQKNGRDKPWRVKYWGLGNEAWGCGGNMTASYYANLYRQYATFMTGWSNTANLFRIASGANSADYQWTETLMREIPFNLIEGIALHHYAVKDWHNRGPSTGFSQQEYFDNLKAALKIDEVITQHAAIMDQFDPERKIALVVDEWGAWYNPDPHTNPGFLKQQNTMRDAVIAGLTLNIFNKHASRLRMANLAQTVNVLQAVIMTEGEKMWLTPTYHVMDMYKVHQDAMLLETEVIACETIPIEKKNFQSISISASQADDNHIHITLVNMNPQTKAGIDLEISNSPVHSVNASLLASDRVDNHNTMDQPDRVKPIDFPDVKVNGGSIQFEMPPFSVCHLKIQ